VAVTIALEHRTSYRFDRPVTLGPHLVRLRPAPHTRTPIESYSLTVSPSDHFVNWQQDAFGNHIARLVFNEPVTELDITVDLVADLTVINPLDFFIEEYAETYPFHYPPMLAMDLAAYRAPVDEDPVQGGGPGPALRQWLAGTGLAGEHAAGRSTVSVLSDLNRRLAGLIGYSVRLEHGVQSPDETLDRAIGSCRDTAWLLVSAARELGLAARFVSGYLVQLAPDVLDRNRPLTEDFTDLHAWAEVFIPGAGWIGLDPTSGLFAGEGHIPLAATPHPGEAAPISGMRSAAEATMDFSNTVRRIVDRPRATRPYGHDQWQRVLALGEQVDDRLRADDVRLTMGGEPTFVSARDTTAAEWNVAADGDDKRARAIELTGRLKASYAPSGIVQHGQGKWYPGEPLPRWQMAICWLADGTALWHRDDLLDAPWSTPTHQAAEGPALAARLIAGIARRLGIDPSPPAGIVLPAYADRLQQVLAEAQLPDGDPPAIDVTEPSTADARAELTRLLDADSGEPEGWVLPLHRSEDGRRWATTRWRTRRGRLILIAGTSPVGMRLPLRSISWTPPPGRPDRSPFAEPADLPDQADLGSAGEVTPADVVEVTDAPTTALTVESREGHLFIFLPPLTELADAIELLAAVEGAAAELGIPVVLEGYPIPGDDRSRSLSVTPDPGVIEVNVQPASSWSELVSITETLDAAARESGLATEKFAYDGTHTGTGGGSHLTLGGASPADSPLLRRPSLLISLLTFWQNHPSLSYLFSGRFIGPTSQAPRVDEARHESLYELEIAFAELDRLADLARPWTVDRALRHLLTDITGNTHRAEFCIDKMFSPDSDRGRLGLLELRGFEMPPHPRMSLVQALLVRSLVARFWREPYRAPLVRWGTRLHDRFLLPAFVADDLAEVIADLNQHGIAFELDWLQPFLEFRFPRLARQRIGPVTVELRGAIEPWHVLGEEATGSGTARYVDSSVERLQVSVTGAVPGRHRLSCNGVEVALHPTDTADEQVAGIRFRAWAPPSALHPTIGIHSPLVFEIIDTWNDHSLGGLTYHVVHPGGRAYDTPPVNANEAEARRAARVVPGGHAAPVSATPTANVARPGAEYPVTLDLRTVIVGHGAVGHGAVGHGAGEPDPSGAAR
jgi:uncharacterized protein (DUF2126 family)/transglutaminase-like putative cysteine protease